MRKKYEKLFGILAPALYVSIDVGGASVPTRPHYVVLRIRALYLALYLLCIWTGG